MAAATLRHYATSLTGQTTQIVIPSTAVVAGRALVIGKLILASGVTATCHIALTGYIGYGISLTPGSQYSETGLVVLPGETLTVLASAYTGTTGNAVWIHAFGEEVDN